MHDPGIYVIYLASTSEWERAIVVDRSMVRTIRSPATGQTMEVGVPRVVTTDVLHELPQAEVGSERVRAALLDALRREASDAPPAAGQLCVERLELDAFRILEGGLDVLRDDPECAPLVDRLRGEPGLHLYLRYDEEDEEDEDDDDEEDEDDDDDDDDDDEE